PYRTRPTRGARGADLKKRDNPPCHYGRERGKLITAEADAEWQKRRACEARQPESNYSPGFVLHSGANLKDNNQQDRKRDIDPACRHDPGDERDQHASYRHHRPEGRHREGGTLGRDATLDAEIQLGPVAVQRLEDAVEKYGGGIEPEPGRQIPQTDRCRRSGDSRPRSGPERPGQSNAEEKHHDTSHYD